MAATHERPAGELRRVLTLPALVLFGLVYMVPLTVFTTYGLVTVQTGGRLPTTYLITSVAMFVTALSYGAMVRAFPVAGSTFTYATSVFGPVVGFVAGWSLLLDYMFLPMINYLVIGLYLNAQLPSIAPWVFVLAGILAVTVLNVVGIDSIAKANLVIIAAQAIFIAASRCWPLGPTRVRVRRAVRRERVHASDGVDPSHGIGPLLAGAWQSFVSRFSVSTPFRPWPRRCPSRAATFHARSPG
ncbi:MAG: APC family permease [Vicinamibacterales bacterium]